MKTMRRRLPGAWSAAGILARRKSQLLQSFVCVVIVEPSALALGAKAFRRKADAVHRIGKHDSCERNKDARITPAWHSKYDLGCNGKHRDAAEPNRDDRGRILMGAIRVEWPERNPPSDGQHETCDGQAHECG